MTWQVLFESVKVKKKYGNTPGLEEAGKTWELKAMWRDLGTEKGHWQKFWGYRRESVSQLQH